MPELDLATPGTFAASAENASRYRIYLVLGSSALTPDAIAGDPERDAAEIVFKSAWLPDAGGGIEYALTEADTVAIERSLAGKVDGEVRSVVIAADAGGGTVGADGGSLRVKHGHIVSARLLDDETGEPLAGVSYDIVDEAGAVVESGVTPDSGLIEHNVPAAARYRIRLAE